MVQISPMRAARFVLGTLLGVVGCGQSTVSPGARSSGAVDAGLPMDALPIDTGAAVMDASTPDMGLVEPDAGVVPSGPIVAPPMEWTWVDFPESRCMNDTPTGIGVNLNPASNKVLIFLNGGNACFNQTTCFITANTDGYGETKFNTERGGLNASAFDRGAAENIFADWSYVYLPYCSGDVFGGARDSSTIAGTRWTFVGYRNVGQFLERLVPTFGGATDVVITGVSAGGFGAMLNFDRVQRAFGASVRVTLINDSGAPLSSTFLAPCLQQHFRTTWGLDDGPFAACPDCLTTADGRFTEPYAEYLATTYPDRSLGLISSDADGTIRTFYGFGENNCANINDLFAPNYRADQFRMGLLDLRDNVFGAFGNFKLWMPPGERHVWLNSPPWMTELDGVTLSDWMQQAIDGDPMWNHVPVP